MNKILIIIFVFLFSFPCYARGQLITKQDTLIVFPSASIQKNNTVETDTLEIVNNMKAAILWGFTMGLISYTIIEYQRNFENRGRPTVKKASD